MEQRVGVVPSKLPLEILRMIFLKIDEDNPFEELKKCRLVSPRFYKAVQDLFQDEFVQKCCTQFDGSRLNYTKCRTFGMNLFGSYKLNFPTVKISRSEYYLMKSWLEKLFPTKLQTLELKDNHLDWKEIILVLKKFSSIVNLKFLQTSEDMKVAEQILKLCQIKGGFEPRVREQFAKRGIFLPNLKNFEAHIVHFEVLNILSFIISRARCQLESFSITIDINGVCQSSQMSRKKSLKILKKPHLHLNSLKIHSLKHLKRFSKSLKNLKIQIFILDNIRYNRLRPNPLFKISESTGYRIVYKSILRMFLNPEKMKKFTQIQNFKISLLSKCPYLVDFFDEKHKIGLFEFVKNQKNLQNFDLSPLLAEPQNDEDMNEFRDILRNLMVTPKSTFEYRYCISDMGFEPILGFSENLSKLRILYYNSDTQWHFSNPRTPVFINCTSLQIYFLNLIDWNDFEVRYMVEKFPNLTKLVLIIDQSIDNTTFTNNDLQLIIKHYKDLKELQIEHLTKSYDYDSGLTGLSLGAIEARKENPGLPIGPEDRVGLPISHLKNLESLVIKSVHIRPRLQISDQSAQYAFDKMPNLKYLDLEYTNITRNGFDTILDKTKSKNLNILQLDPTNFDDSDSDND